MSISRGAYLNGGQVDKNHQIRIVCLFGDSENNPYDAKKDSDMLTTLLRR